MNVKNHYISILYNFNYLIFIIIFCLCFKSNKKKLFFTLYYLSYGPLISNNRHVKTPPKLGVLVMAKWLEMVLRR